MDTTFSQSVIDECADRVGLIFRSHIVARVEGRTLEQQWEEAIELLNTQLDFMRAVITPGVIIPRFLIALDLQLSQRRGRWPAWRAIIDGDVQGNTDHPWMEYQAKTPPTSPTTSSPQTPEGRVSAPSPSRISLAPPTVVPAGNKKPSRRPRCLLKGKPRPHSLDQTKAREGHKGKGKATAVQDVAKNAKPQPKVDKGKAKAATVAERSDSSQSKVLARTSSKPKEDKGKGKKKQGAEKVPRSRRRSRRLSLKTLRKKLADGLVFEGSPTVEDNRAQEPTRWLSSVTLGSCSPRSLHLEQEAQSLEGQVKPSRNQPQHSRSPFPTRPHSRPLPTNPASGVPNATPLVNMWKAAHVNNATEARCPVASNPPLHLGRLLGQQEASSTESSQQKDVADGKEARQSPPPKRAKRNAPKGFPVGPPKRTAVVVQTGARRKQVLDAVVITTHKKGRPHVIPTAQSSSGRQLHRLLPRQFKNPMCRSLREEFNRLQEQLQQLKMLHIVVREAMQTFGRILDILRQGEPAIPPRRPFTTFQAAKATSAPSTPPRSAENALGPSSPTPRAGIATTMGSLHAQSRWLVLSSPPPCRNAAPDRASTPSQARPSPWLSPMQVSATPPFEPPRKRRPPAEELPVPGLQTGVDTGDEETDSREASASGMQGLLDYLGDSEDDNMDVVTAEAKEHEV
ncbi:hypothetical protein EV363DRAFT_1453389 [Boletus edulis]|nr:hypothetical protein EV363DRAFT_1453389 [Boletus edulis]